jgi:T5SS/PEP-CTERM-associated repeat protein/autotransporter-associated beta strand protein
LKQRSHLTDPVVTSAWKQALLAVLAVSVSIADAEAARPFTLWNVPAGDFFDSGNWSLGMPDTNVDAKIDNGGVVQITSPAFQSVSYVYLGSTQNTSGTLEVLSGGVASFTTMIVGALNATGTLRVSGGGKLTSFGGPIGSDYLGVGLATVDGAGSSWQVTGSEMVVGGNGIGTLRLQNFGNLMVANGAGRIQLANHPVSEGTFQIGNGGTAATLNAAELYNGEGRARVIFNHSDSAYTFAPRLHGLKTVNGYLNIEHNGPGTTILTATESNLAGSITVSAGKLLVNGQIKGSTTQVLVDEQVVSETTIHTMSVLPGGTLGGLGFIEGATTIGGTLSPGMSAGVLKFGGNLSLSSSATVRMELGGTLRGTQFDAVEVAGTLLYAGTLEIVLINGFVPAIGATFDLFDGFASQSGNFSNITFSSPNRAGTFNPETGVLTVSEVPEPSVLGLAALGFAVLGFRRREQKKASTSLR